MESIDEHVKRLHEECIIVDAHYDLLENVDIERSKGYRNVIKTKYLKSINEGMVDVIVCSLFIPTMYLPEMGLKKALDQISALYSEIDESEGRIVLCRTYDDIISAKKEKRLALLLSLEGVDPLTNDINLLRIFYELGVRFVGLAWSRRNFAADGCKTCKGKKGREWGLTEFGSELVKEAEKLGMIIDVSHLNDGGFDDVMNMTNGPVIASHSNCREIACNMRNLMDDQIVKISERGGVIGMNACSAFVSDDEKLRDASHLAEHVDHIKQIAGIEHVGLGFDFNDFLIPAYDVGPKDTDYDVIKGHNHIKYFTKILIESGYSDEEIKLVLGKNFMNLYKRLQ